MRFEPGKYRGRIRDYGVIMAVDEGKYDQVTIDFDVIGRYDLANDQLQDCPVAVRTYYKSTHPNSLEYLLLDLKFLGYDKPSFRYLDPEVEGAVDWFGKEVDVTCEIESWNGNSREQWSILRGQPRQKADAESLARLDARCADKLKKAFGASQPAAPLTTPNTSTEMF
jgi:hypothetical protein